MKHILPLLLLAVLMEACGNRVSLSSLTVEMQDGSQPLATAQPRFSWQYESNAQNVVQTHYRVVVSSTEENARKGIGDLWDSGLIESSDMLYIPYGGKQLHSRDIAYWKVFATLTYGEKGRQAST